MGLIDNQKIKYIWNKYNKKKFEKLGYIFTEFGNEFFVDINDISNRSNLNIRTTCDCCNKETSTRYCRYTDQIEKYGNYYCKECTQKRKLNERIEQHYSDVMKYCDDNDYILLSKKDEMYDNNVHIKFLCKNHGILEKPISGILSNKKCKFCANDLRKKKSIGMWNLSLNDRSEKYYNECIDICEEYEYELISNKNDIINYDSIVEYSCSKHGYQKMNFKNFHSGKRCPQCSSSKGENRVRKWLKENNILFYEQYSFSDCKNIRHLPFDFYLYDKHICIEYDGELHFHPVKFSLKMTDELAQNKFLSVRINDSIKDKYCQDNNIKLIRISYKNFNKIENILEKYITYEDIV